MNEVTIYSNGDLKLPCSWFSPTDAKEMIHHIESQYENLNVSTDRYIECVSIDDAHLFTFNVPPNNIYDNYIFSFTVRNDNAIRISTGFRLSIRHDDVAIFVLVLKFIVRVLHDQ